MERWPPRADNPKRCTNCGEHVSDEFRRAASDETGRVHACPSCTEYRELPRAALGLEPLSNDEIAADGGEWL